MIKKIIDGKECIQRDVVYSDFGAISDTEKKITYLKSEGIYKTDLGRKSAFDDRVYSWASDSIYEYDSDRLEGTDETYSLESDRIYSILDSTDPTLVEKDTMYAGMLSTRLMTLRRPLAMQLKELYMDHTRMYRTKKQSLKPADLDLLIEDFRFELHRIIAKAKDMVIKDGGNMESILKVGSLGAGPNLQNTLRKLTVLFKRIEDSYNQFGYIPRNFQTQMNDALSVLVSHFILDVYGSELEKRKLETTSLNNLKS